MRYDKIGQFELKRDVVQIVQLVGILSYIFYFRYIVLFNILNHDQRIIESYKGFGHHVEVKDVNVNINSNMGSRKWFKVGRISSSVDRKCVNAERNSFNVNGNRFMGRGKWNNGSRKTFIVKGKSFIVSKKTKYVKNKQCVECL